MSFGMGRVVNPIAIAAKMEATLMQNTMRWWMVDSPARDRKINVIKISNDTIDRELKPRVIFDPSLLVDTYVL
jgi:hypothetical protein